MATSYKPENFIIKVFATKAQAEKNDINDALNVFNNSTTGGSSDPRVGNGAQYVTGSGTLNNGTTLVEPVETFGGRLVGKQVEVNVPSGVYAGDYIGTVSSVSTDGSTLTFDTNSWIYSSTRATFAVGLFPTATTSAYFVINPGPFYIFERYFYRIESTDPVSGFIIDWDDGEDNSKENANRQIIRLDSLAYYAIVEHTYTKHGVFYPMVRSISPEGFFSKWYVSQQAASEDDLYTIEPQSLSSVGGENEFSQISTDLIQGSSVLCRIPEFAPANSPPVGVLKVDRKTVFSGIDNDAIPTGTAAATIGIVTAFDNIVTSSTPSPADGEYSNVPLNGGTGKGLKADISIRGGSITSVTVRNGGTGYTAHDALRIPWSHVGSKGKDSTRKKGVTHVNSTVRVASIAATTYADINVKGYAFVPRVKIIEQWVNERGVDIAHGKGRGVRKYNKDGTYTFEQFGVETWQESVIGADSSFHLEDALEVIYRNHLDKVYKETIDITSGITNPTIPFEGATFPKTGNGYLKEVLSVKLIRLLEGTQNDKEDKLLPNERVLIQCYDVGGGGSLHDVSTDPTITMVSLGNPIQTLDRPGFSVSCDASLSQTRASNVSLSKFWFENGKLSGTTRQETDTTQISDSLGKSVDDYDQTESTVVYSYTFSPSQSNAVNEKTHRFYDEERLIRVQVEDTSANTRVDGTSAADGIEGDTLTRSFVEHWDRTSYIDNRTIPSYLHSRALLLYANSGNYSGDLGQEKWKNAASDCWKNTGSSSESGDTNLIFGGTNSAGATANDTQLTTADSDDTVATGIDKAPARAGTAEIASNWVLCGKDKQFNRLHFRMDNEVIDTAGGAGTTSRCGGREIYRHHENNLEVYYTAKATKSSTNYEWKPLSIIDGTSHGKNNESLRCSGSITFDIPDDWVKVKSSDLTSGRPVTLNTGESDDPESLWTDDMYGILIGIASKNFYRDRFRCVSIIPYNNTHSTAIKIVDPHHSSLNNITIAQSVSWTRNGRIIDITDKLGRTELRKIGAQGGDISFGGVELAGDYKTTKAVVTRYQREGVPVYLDIERSNGDYIRFYGLIKSLSEDVPTGMSIPKWGIQMGVEYICEISSQGDWISPGLIALGGEIIDEPKYLL